MSLSKSVVESLKQLGIVMASKPEFPIPGLPRDISEMDDEGLMDLFVQFTQWNDYLSGARAISVINEREAERALEMQEASVKMSNWTGAKTDRVAITKAIAASDPQSIELRNDVDTKYAFRKLLETRAEDVERNSQVVSRELTRRTSGTSGIRSRSRAFSA